MRQNTLLITVTLIGLFVISLVVGYFAGERFFKPQPSGKPGETAARPEAPPTVRPSPAGPGAPAASPQPTAVPATPPQATPGPAATSAAPATPAESPTSQRTPGVSGTREAAPGQQAVLYKVQVGAFSTRENAEEREAALRRDGFSPYLVIERGLYKVRVGAFRNRATAEELAERVRARGYEVVIVP